MGNIKTKTDMGSYTYEPNRPHVVATAGDRSYTHDPNGSMLTGVGRTFTWNKANLPVTIKQDATSLYFSYDPERELFKQANVTGGTTETTYYLGRLYEQITKGSLTTRRHYIQANGQTVALYTTRSNNNNDLRYLLPDHLGSVDAITNNLGQIAERLSYDAWGRRRPANWARREGAEHPVNVRPAERPHREVRAGERDQSG